MLIADGVLLRPFKNSDAAAFAAAVLESADTAGRWLPWCRAGYSEQDALAWFAVCHAAREAGSAYDFAVICQDSGEFLGGVGLNQIMSHLPFCNLGYWVRQSRQRQGIALRCVQALSRYAFEQIGLHRVEIVVACGNLASEALALKVGAQRESLARNRLLLHGTPVDAHMFALLPGPAQAA
ncbi:GNAT family N-acetyltransferase [Undibacterium sp. Ren11W]|uniref:GNAT family N-acetyltransferase n=1 Tax=Undibacterium sp. Ren11W TaxID=3413045 RepID=UPI003BF110EE